MLRSVTVHNFVHFLQPQRVEFCDGTNFLIGENSTGKSATLELVRRCLSNKISTTTTSVVEKKETAYAVCHFKIPSDYTECPILDAEKNNPTDIIAGLFVESRNSSGTENETDNLNDNYKLFCQISNGKPHRLYVQHYEGFHGCSANELQMKSYKSLLCDDLTNTIKSILTVGQKKDVIDFIDTIRDRMAEMKETIQCECVDAVYKWLENGYVSILPMRSIGPLQWTRSDKNKQEYMNENYSTACNRAEIITQLLGSDKIDKELEEKYDRNLVFPYKFQKTNDGIRVKNMEQSNSSSQPLLKTPEGFVEAKQMTLILAHKELYTITYEDPDRGMHPHMIKKMRDLVLRNVKGKTVIVVSHNPAITNQWTMERTHICSKAKHESGETIHYICKVPSGFNRYGRVDEMKCLLFSSRILFVEGLVDKIILEAIFSLLINDEKIQSDKQIPQELKEYLLGTDVLELSSAGEGNKKKEFCDKLKKINFIIYDADVFENKTPIAGPSSSNTPESDKNFKISKDGKLVKGRNKDIRVDGFRINGKNKGVEYTEVFKDREDFMEEANFSRFENACEKARVFCWKNGAIEKRIIEVLDNCDANDKKIVELITNLVYFGTEKKPKGTHNSVQQYVDTKVKAHKQEIIKGLKKHIPHADYSDIAQLAKEVINRSKEIDRLKVFLSKMRTKDLTYFKKEPANRKRGISDENLNEGYVKKPAVYSSCERESLQEQDPKMETEDTNESTETHTGQTQEMEDVAI